MKFEDYAAKIEKRFSTMSKGDLYVVDIEPDAIWDKYMASFPEGTNNIYRERREYDCSCCKQFIRRIGNVVAIKNGKLISIWDVETEGYYQVVTDALNAFVTASNIDTIFLSQESKAGAKSTKELLESGSVKVWNHFHCDIAKKNVERDRATKVGMINSKHGVFKRGLKELTIESLEIVLELIDQDSIYRGAEFKQTVNEFYNLKKKYDKSKAKKIFTWENVYDNSALIRNSAIGTLLQDISNGIELTEAVASFENKVSGTNYKRTTALVTEGMKKNALKTIKELGIENSLFRRYAHIDDISINNVIFSDRSTSALMKDSLEAILDKTVQKKSEKTFDIIESVNIDDFIKTIVPKAETIEVMFENKHTSNLVSLIAPREEAPNILKWDNNFSWSYFGDITDSMKERVKSAGGNVTGDLRFSIQWNEEGNDGVNDLDAHCISPKSHIYYSDKHGSCGGHLDVDITRPNSQTKNGIAVENITWHRTSDMPDGEYKFYVHNFARKNTNGFRAQIEIEGTIYDFNYPKSVTVNVNVATVTLKNGKFTIKTHLESSASTKEEWGISTNEFQKVKTIMLSPNHWDKNETGNKHYMFMLDNCINPDKARGLYNEFLKGSLNPHRKVFEVLGSQIKCEQDDNQLSGLGFSSTVRNELIVKVSGTFNRTIKIKF